MLRQGGERLKELEEIMENTGLFNDQFSLGLGDVMEEVVDQPDTPQEQDKTKKKSVAFPPIEGSETAPEFVAKYKKACLNRRALFKDISDKWQAAKPSTGQSLGVPKEFPNFVVFWFGNG